MITIQKLLGSHGCFYASGAEKLAMPVGYAAYALVIAADSTEIATLDELVDGVLTELADASWEGVALQRGNYIPLKNPCVNITLTNEGDAVFCYLEPTEYIVPE